VASLWCPGRDLNSNHACGDFATIRTISRNHNRNRISCNGFPRSLRAIPRTDRNSIVPIGRVVAAHLRHKNGTRFLGRATRAGARRDSEVSPLTASPPRANCGSVAHDSDAGRRPYRSTIALRVCSPAGVLTA